MKTMLLLLVVLAGCGPDLGQTEILDAGVATVDGDHCAMAETGRSICTADGERLTCAPCSREAGCFRSILPPPNHYLWMNSGRCSAAP